MVEENMNEIDKYQPTYKAQALILCLGGGRYSNTRLLQIIYYQKVVYYHVIGMLYRLSLHFEYCLSRAILSVEQYRGLKIRHHTLWAMFTYSFPTCIFTTFCLDISVILRYCTDMIHVVSCFWPINFGTSGSIGCLLCWKNLINILIYKY